MNDAQKREELKKVYKSPAWLARVKRMKPEQVTAIYLRLKAQGKLK